MNIKRLLNQSFPISFCLNDSNLEKRILSRIELEPPTALLDLFTKNETKFRSLNKTKFSVAIKLRITHTTKGVVCKKAKLTILIVRNDKTRY